MLSPRWPFPTIIPPFSGEPSDMLPIDDTARAQLQLEWSVKRQEHADLDTAITTLLATGVSDAMMIQRMKKRKLALKDRIREIERVIIPDIIA
jgi:hypothetical protein